MKPETERDILKDIRWYIKVIACMLGMVIGIMLAGCTTTLTKRITTETISQCCHLPTKTTTEYTSFAHREFLMRSTMEDAEVVIDGAYRHYSISSREQAPDPNSVRAVTEGVVSGVVGGGL